MGSHVNFLIKLITHFVNMIIEVDALSGRRKHSFKVQEPNRHLLSVAYYCYETVELIHSLTADAPGQIALINNSHAERSRLTNY